MALEKNYQALFQQSVAKCFPEWDGISPLDPSKVFVEGLSLATAEIERRHARLTETLMDSLPSLFGFRAKEAFAPCGLFEWVPSASLSSTKTIPEGTAFAFPSLTPLVAELVEETQLVPLVEFNVHLSPGRIGITFLSKAPLTQLSFLYIPQQEGLTPQPLRELTVTASPSGGKPKHRDLSDLIIDDSTMGFSKMGRFSIKPRPNTELLLASEKDTTLSVNLTLSQPTILDGQLGCHFFQARLVRYDEQILLGHLKGDPWEEVALPKETLEPPRSLRLDYPDDRSERLERLELDLLQIRLTDQARFGRAFFYNATNHSLIIPCAPELMSHYSGGIKVVAPLLKTTPGSDWLGGTPVTASPGELAAFIDSVRSLSPLKPYRPREDKLRYLKRFYTCLRNMDQENISIPLKPREIVQHLLGAHAEIESVEIDTDSKNKTLSVFVKERATVTFRGPLSSVVRNAVSDKLSKCAPLDYRWGVHPFSAFSIRADVDLSLESESEQIAAFSESQMAFAVRETLAELLSLSLWQPNFSEPVEHLAARLKNRLNSATLFSSFPVKDLRLLVTDLATGNYLTNLSRKTGTCFLPETFLQYRFVKRFLQNEETELPSKERVLK